MMSFPKHHHKIEICRLIIFILLFPAGLNAETKTWTGFGGDTNWSNPLNWSGAGLPQSTDDILLDNSGMPVSYQVTLPDLPIIIRTLHIDPSPGRTIELVLPPTNKITDAFSVTGPGYGIELNAGAIFRNASGISSGESLRIADSMIIHDGGRYIHQTRASHANSILKFLSTAPGTEQGIFDFDVPRASYTLSVSNRIYGSLELHAGANGAMVNYTCTGANPLRVRGNLRIGPSVSMSMDLSGSNGNLQVDGDFIQEGGQLNLASGTGDNTVLRIKGDLYQSSAATITETNNGNPFLELNGERMQEIAMAGRILNQVGFRINNASGSALRLPLTLPWKLELTQGVFTSSAAALLILDTGCSIGIDSSRLTGVYVDGPVRKLALALEDHFLFPVGKEGNLHWLELKNATGNYTVEYFRQDPAGIGSALGSGLDHISKIEYWSVLADGVMNGQAKIELSFTSALSGGLTDPDYLNVAKFQSGQWEDGGHEAVTGNFVQGSVLSGNTDFVASEYTLASTIDLENPLPITIVNLEINEILNKPVFSWSVESPEIPDHFDIYEENGGKSTHITEVMAVHHQISYHWSWEPVMKKGNHYFRIRMVDIHGNEYSGKIVLFRKEDENIRLTRLSSCIREGTTNILIRSDFPDEWKYEIISINGAVFKKGSLTLGMGINCLMVGKEMIPAGIYIFRAMDSSGEKYSLLFIKY